MFKRHKTRADRRAFSLRSTLTAATAPAREAAWIVEERLVWPGADRLRGVAEAIKWPFERVAWAIEQRLFWPLQERAADWGAPARAAVAGALVVIVVGAGVLGAVMASNGTEGSKPSVVVASLAAARQTPRPAVEAPKAPVLQGTPPVFEAPRSAVVPKSTSAVPTTATAPTSSDAATADSKQEGATAGASSEKPVPDGPVAMKAARRFAEAFVLYEVGERLARAQTVFAETATPQLASSLLKRPPRLPANTNVPQAKVLNLVPGPRQGKAYTVSVSLLRLGVTSELRLEMKKTNGTWLVTDVRG